jgi:DNA helicase HerA-like ATPase
MTTENQINPFIDENLIGRVRHSRTNSMSVMLRQDLIDAGAVNIGNYCVAKTGNNAIFGLISQIMLTNEGAQGAVELIASVNLANGRVSPGVNESPAVGGNVYLVDGEFVKYVVENQNQASGGVILHLGSLPQNADTPLCFTPERIFGRHLAILGTSGSGKSWSTARLIEESAKLNSKLILLDATGEYNTLKEGVKHVYLGIDPNPQTNSSPVTLPYFQLTQNDLFGIFQPSGQSQAAALRSAIESLKIARLAPHLAPDGTIIKAHRSKMEYQNEFRRFQAQIEDSRALFDVAMLPYQIRHECVESQRSPTEPHYWGGHSQIDYSACVPLINRISDIITSPSLQPIFNPQSVRSILDDINLFMKDTRYRVLRLSLKYLSFSHNTREIVANAIGRHLMELARTGAFRTQPLVILIDEAHQFLNNTLITTNTIFPLDSFALIAKEGRKYALTVALATQRPRDIPEDILSQMGTLLIHRLINDNDRKIIERASGEMDSASAASIPILASGQGIIVGVDFPVPLSIKMTPPESPPDSRGADYQTYWKR